MANHEPAVRVLDDGRRPARWAPGGPALVLAGAVGLVIGLGIGAMVAGGGESPAPDTTLAAAAPSLADDVPPESTTTTTTTALRRRSQPAPPAPPTLADTVAGLKTPLLAAFPGTRELWRWRPESPLPDLGTLPPGAGHIRWDASGEWAAVLGDFRGGRGSILYAGRGANLVPLATDVATIAWHSDEPGRLAWVDIGGDVPTVQALDLDTSEQAEGFTVPAPLIPVLQAWGDWGYAFSVAGFEDGFPELLVVDGRGTEVARSAEMELVATGPGGVMLVALPGGGDAVTGPDLAEPMRVAWPRLGPVVWSPSGCCVAAIVESDLDDALLIHDRERPTFRILTGSRGSTVLAWSPDERFVVLYVRNSGTLLRGASSEPALVFADLEDKSVHAVAVADAPLGAAFEGG